MATTASTAPAPTEASTSAAKPAPKKASPAAKPVAPKAPVAKVPAKTAVKAAAKPAAKPVPKAPVAKAEKPKKPKMVRDSLSIPKDEYEVIAVLKVRAGKLGHAAKKTEIIRAGIKAIAALSDQSLLKALQSVPSIKTGRPAKNKSK